MPSITTWSRLEPRSVGEDVATGDAARGHDALWLLARQWQGGGVPRGNGGAPSAGGGGGRGGPAPRYVAGPIPPNTQLNAPTFDARALPLETLVERQRLQQSAFVDGIDGLRLAVESGQHFLRLLRLQVATPDPSAAFV